MAIAQNLESGRVLAQTIAPNSGQCGNLDGDNFAFPQPLILNQYFIDSDAAFEEGTDPA